jgi:hypothetical protein
MPLSLLFVFHVDDNAVYIPFLRLLRHCDHIVNGIKRYVDMKSRTVFSKRVNWFEQLNIRILSESIDCLKFCCILTTLRKVNLFQ